MKGLVVHYSNDLRAHPLRSLIQHVQLDYFPNKDFEYHTIDNKKYEIEQYVPSFISRMFSNVVHTTHFAEDFVGFLTNHTKEYQIVFLTNVDGNIDKIMSLLTENGILVIINSNNTNTDNFDVKTVHKYGFDYLIVKQHKTFTYRLTSTERKAIHRVLNEHFTYDQLQSWCTNVGVDSGDGQTKCTFSKAITEFLWLAHCSNKALKKHTDILRKLQIYVLGLDSAISPQQVCNTLKHIYTPKKGYSKKGLAASIVGALSLLGLRGSEQTKYIGHKSDMVSDLIIGLRELPDEAFQIGEVWTDGQYEQSHRIATIDTLTDYHDTLPLTYVGSGAYSHVFKLVDDDVAVKYGSYATVAEATSEMSNMSILDDLGIGLTFLGGEVATTEDANNFILKKPSFTHQPIHYPVSSVYAMQHVDTTAYLHLIEHPNDARYMQTKILSAVAILRDAGFSHNDLHLNNVGVQYDDQDDFGIVLLDPQFMTPYDVKNMKNDDFQRVKNSIKQFN